MQVLHYNSKSSATTILNSTAETALYAISIPTNTLLTAGRQIRWHLHGSILGTDTTNPRVTIRTKIRADTTSTGLGTAVAATTGWLVPTSTLTRAWQIEGGVVASSSSIQIHWVDLRVGTAGTGIKPTTFDMTGRGTSTQNTNQALRLNVTAQLSLLSTQYTLTAHVGGVEMLRP